MDSRSDSDSEDEYIEERARRARNRPASTAKPGEDTVVPMTAVKQEPMGGDESHRTSSFDAVAVRAIIERRSSTLVLNYGGSYVVKCRVSRRGS